MPELADDFEEDVADDEDPGGAAGEAESEEEEEEGYVWVSTGESCPQCEAWDGQFFQVLPERPHEDCDCEVDVDHGEPDLFEVGFDDLEAEAWNELYDRAEEIAAQNCRDDCSPPLHV